MVSFPSFLLLFPLPSLFQDSCISIEETRRGTGTQRHERGRLGEGFTSSKEALAMPAHCSDLRISPRNVIWCCRICPANWGLGYRALRLTPGRSAGCSKTPFSPSLKRLFRAGKVIDRANLRDVSSRKPRLGSQNARHNLLPIMSTQASDFCNISVRKKPGSPRVTDIYNPAPWLRFSGSGSRIFRLWVFRARKPGSPGSDPLPYESLALACSIALYNYP